MKRYKLWLWILGLLGLFLAVWGNLTYSQPHGGAIAILDTASDIGTDVTDFDGDLGSGDTDVQKALDTLDDATSTVEGTAVLSTGEGGGTKYLREDGDGTCSWQTPAGSGDFLADGTVDMTGNFNINTQAIEDANSNELVTFITGASAVNNIQITNAAAGDGVKITAVGGDTNIDLHLEPKGIGIIRLEETLPATVGQSLAEIIIDVDSSAQVSTSEFHAILVETTGTPAGEVSAIGTVGKVDPIHQHVATFATPNQDEFAGKKITGGTVWVDGDTPAIGENLDANDMFFADDDEIYFGSATQFDEVEVIMGTGATKNVNVTFWYNTAADAWTQFFPDDGTDGFQQSGDIIWLLSGITGLWTGNGDPGVDDTTAGYWIKIIRTRVADPGSPTPTTIKIGLATTYSWDRTGAIDALSVEGDTLTEGGVAVLNTGEYDAGTDPTADLEEEVTEGSLADSTIVSADIKNGEVALVDIAAAAYAKDIVTTAPITGATDNVLVGADGDVTIALDFTAAWNFGGVSDFEIYNDAAPTTDVAGEIALDTTITDHQPLLQYYDGGENMTVIAVDTAELPALDNEIVKYNAATDKFVLEADAGAGGAAEINVLLKPQSAKLPTSAYAVIDASASGWSLLYDDTAQEFAAWEFILDDDYGSGTLYADVYFSMASGEADEVQFEAYVMAVTATTDNADWDTDSYDTENVGVTTVAATAGRPYKQTITLSNDDSLAAGDMIRIKLSTDSDDAVNDDATGDREIRYVVIRE